MTISARDGEPHQLRREPAPVADGWLGICTCGWRRMVSFYEFDTRDDVFAEIDRLFAEHTSQAETP